VSLDFVIYDDPRMTATEVDLPVRHRDLIVFDGPRTTAADGDFILFDAATAPTIVAEDTTGGSLLVITGGRGPRGPVGPPGPTTDAYTHTQDTPSASWVVVHNLGRYVSVTVYVADLIGLADVEHVDLNTLSITFPQATVGVAAIR
jgi:hypothetical protein